MSEFLATILSALTALWPGGDDTSALIYNGYLEGDFVYLSAAAPGKLTEVRVAEGDLVEAGDTLFLIENTHQINALAAAEARVAIAEANLENLQTGGRGAEIDVVRASLQQAEADQTLATTNAQRSAELFSRGLAPQAKVDADQAMLDSANARVAQLRAQLEVAELPARDAQRIAAEAALDAAKAERAEAQAALADREVTAPDAGTVDRVYFDEGEMVGGGAPVLSLLPPDHMKVLFFVPEADRAGIALGDLYGVECEGCPEGLTARITRLASTPQYTPPILYSRDERSRLVFRAEAFLDDPAGLLPGQPVSVWPKP
jgi:HlyD family secretion protein